MKHLLDNELLQDFFRTPSAILSLLVLLSIVFTAIFAPWIVSQNPFDPLQLDLLNSRLPPVWQETGVAEFPLGTDEQGRDILASLFYGARLSLLVGLASVTFSFCLGVLLGLLAGYFRGWVDTTVTRLADLQMTIPGLLVAMMLAGVIKTQLPAEMQETVMIYVVILAIGFSDWPRYARVTRSATMVEAGEDYVLAAKVMGAPSRIILWRHVLPNVLRANIVIATVGLGIAIMLEATLSFLGAGVPGTTPSLGTLIRIGTNYLFSGEWWTVVFPGMMLILTVFSINILGDWLRDALNPKMEHGHA